MKIILNFAVLILLFGRGMVFPVVSEPVCTRKTMDANFVGGGFLSDSKMITVHSYRDETGLAETRVKVRRVSDGSVIPSESWSVPLPSIHAITCPQKQLVAIALINWSFADGVNVVQPYIYHADGTEVGNVFRSTKDRHWLMYFSPDCTRLLVRSDDKSGQTWDIGNLKGGIVNSFSSRKDGPWMQMASATVGLTPVNKKLQRIGLDGVAGQSKQKKILVRYTMPGVIKHFAVSLDGKWVFVTGKRGARVYKNILRVFKPKTKTLNNDPNDLDTVYTAFAPSGFMFAGIFRQATGNILKVYNTTGAVDGQLTYRLLSDSTARLVYFSPDSSQLVAFGASAAQEFWICRPL